MESIINQFGSYLLNEKKQASNTYLAYVRDLKQFQRFLHQRSLSFERVTKKDIQEFFLFLKYAEGNTVSSIARKMFTLKNFFIWMCDRYDLDNPMIDTTIPKFEKKLPEYLTEDEINRLCMLSRQDSSLTGKRNALLISLLYGTGLRISELTNLTLSSIDLQKAIITLDTHQMRIIPLKDELVAHIHDYLHNVRKNITNGLKGDYLFPVIYGRKIKPLSRQSAWLIVHELAKKAGLEKKVCPQQLRHSFATHTLKKGTDLQTLQTLLGHEQIKNVEVYTRVDASHLRTIYDRKHPRS